MALPEQIRKQTEAVDELYKQMTTTPQGDNADVDEQVDQTQQEQAHADGMLEHESVDQSSGTEQTSDDASAEEGQPKEDFAQKYRTLQGMYNAEVPRLHSQIRELQSKIQQMEQLISTISAQNNVQHQPAKTVEPLVTQNDIDEYGDSIDVMRRVSREELGSVLQKMSQIENMLQQMQTSVVPTVQNLAQKQAVSADQQFWNGLSSAVPEWRDINNNADFQSWLLQPDPFTGITRQSLLEDAQKNLDVGRVATFFNTWLGTSGQASGARNTQPRSNASELERQVAPGKSRNTGTPSGAGTGKTYSPQDIERFFADVRKGKYKGRESERDRIERDIFAAQKDGRIVANA